MKKMKEYYINFWGKFIKEGILNYSYLKKAQRSNSYIVT